MRVDFGADLEQLGLIYAPHTSAGRLPTQLGLRMFVDGLLELGDITSEERRQLEAQIKIKRERSIDQALTEATEMISGLSHCAGVVLAEKQISRLKHIEFVPLEPGRALVVLVGEDQNVENRDHGAAGTAVGAGRSPTLRMRISALHHPGPPADRSRSASAKTELDSLTQKLVREVCRMVGLLGDRKSRSRAVEPARM
jgi:heat-inducible transcriptional repressor